MLSQINHVELHAFSDASKQAIGTAIYFRLIDQYGYVFVTLLFAQSKLSPKRLTTIPRLELCAAVFSIHAMKRMLRELTIEVHEIIFYTDNTVVLSYIQNESHRFFTYVANRVQIIRQAWSPEQWKYIDMSVNPADLVTRSLSPKKLFKIWWYQGPEFLWDNCQLLDPSLLPVKTSECV